jgi:diadenosine tetraphosphate (Ap4A) HIT family hydrolase
MPAPRDAQRRPKGDVGSSRAASPTPTSAPRAPLPGYSSVIWRGRHVADPAEFSTDEAAAYWSEVLIAARALKRVFEPAQINYMILGNSVRHVHTYLLPRYLDDPSPGMPLDPFTEVPVPEDELAGQLDRLRAAVSEP